MSAVTTYTGFILYLLAAALLLKRLAAGAKGKTSDKYAAIGIATLAVVLQAYSLYHSVVQQSGFSFSFFHALSFTAWIVSALILLSVLRQPIENLGIAVFPFTALTVLAQHYSTGGNVILVSAPAGLQAHVLISIISYSVLTLAALQAVLLAVQNHQLRGRNPGGFIRALPPLETMEQLLFRMIAIGYVLLSLSLVSAIPYTQNIIEQHLLHKSVLSVAAWGVFATLLWGRWRYGWRGRTAIRWALGGFIALMLAYFGSKLVLELILGN